MKKTTVIILTIILIGTGYIYYKNTHIDYDKVYENFIDNKLEMFFEANKGAVGLKSDFDDFKDSVICDIDNDGIKELICVFSGDDHTPEAMTVKYNKGKFNLGLSLDIDTNMGMGSAWYTQIIEKDGLYCIYHLESDRQYDPDSDVTHINEEDVIYMMLGDKKEIITTFSCSEEKMYLDGKEVNEWQDIKDGYTVILDSRKYV